MLKIKYDNWIETYSGTKFHPLDPQIQEIHIEDIAHALSNICRFTGHCKEFYSVAQHSVLVSTLCPEYPMEGLLHDATEAYVSDVNTTVKLLLQEYRDLECDIMEVVARKFNLKFPLPKEVKAADLMLLEFEHRALFNSGLKWSISSIKIDDSLEKLKCWTPSEAESKFLDAYKELK